MSRASPGLSSTTKIIDFSLSSADHSICSYTTTASVSRQEKNALRSKLGLSSPISPARHRIESPFGAEVPIRSFPIVPSVSYLALRPSLTVIEVMLHHNDQIPTTYRFNFFDECKC